MSKYVEPKILLLLDLATLNFAYVFYFLFRVRSGWINVSMEPEFWFPMLIICLYWLLLFFMVGLYRPWYAASRFDEIALLFKTITLGCLFLFFAVFVDDQGQNNVPTSSRLLIAIYWGVLFACTSTGRMAMRSVQRRMLMAGIGVRNTVIVGSHTKSRELYQEVVKYPALGYKVVGFVQVGDDQTATVVNQPPLLGRLDSLHEIILA